MFVAINCDPVLLAGNPIAIRRNIFDQLDCQTSAGSDPFAQPAIDGAMVTGLCRSNVRLVALMQILDRLANVPWSPAWILAKSIDCRYARNSPDDLDAAHEITASAGVSSQ